MNTHLLCEDCGWVGLLEDCKEVYKELLTTGGLKIISHLSCPKCGSEELIELTGEPELVPA